MANARASDKAKRGDIYSFDPADLVIIGLDTNDGKDHPLFDERIRLAVDDAMVRNIMANGVIEPVVGRKNGDRVEVVAGRQRVRCAREANARLHTEGLATMLVPVVVRRGDDASMAGIAVSENEIRREDSFKVKAEKARRMIAYGYDEDRIAVTFGVNRATVKTWLAWDDLSSDVKRAVDSGQIAPSAAVKLAALPREDQGKAVEKVIADNGGKATARTVQDATRQKSGKQVSNAPGKRTITKLANHKDASGRLGADFVRALRWVLGEVDDPIVNQILNGEKESDHASV